MILDAYIGLTALGASTIILSIIASKKDDWAENIHLFMKVALMVGGGLLILWVLLNNPLI